MESYGISITTLEEVFLSVNSKKTLKSQKSQISNPEEPVSAKGIEMEEMDYDFQESFMPPLSRFFNLFRVLVWKRLIYFKRDIKGLFMEIVLPILLTIMGCALLTITFITIEPALGMDMTAYDTVQNVIYSGINSITFSDLSTLMGKSGQNLTPYSNTLLTGNSTDQLTLFDNYQFSQYSREQNGAVFFTNISSNNYTFVILANTIAPEAASIYLNAVNQAIFRSVLSNDNFSLKVINSPMPLTYALLQGQQTTSGILASMVFTLAIGFIPASIIVFIVKERESKIKHQQLVSGVSLSAYWFSNFFVDYMKYLIYAISTLIMIQAFKIDIMTDSENYQALIYVFLLNGSSMIAFLYAFQFLFKTYSGAQIAIFILYNVCGTILSIVMLVLQFFDETREPSANAAYFLRLVPTFTFGYSLIANTNIETSALFRGTPPKGALAWENNGVDIFYLGFTTVMYMGLVFVIEMASNSKKVSFKGKPYEEHEKDSDVVEEERLIRESKPQDFPVMVNQLRKVYRENKKVAVEKVSFGVPQGGVFGLLGVNGAGKTTTFKMLTGDINPSAGEAFIYGHDISTQ